LDSQGVETIGIGRNLRDVGITLEEAQYLADNDIASAELALVRNIPFFVRLDPVRKDCFVNLWFNLNHRLLGFQKMLAAASIGDWNEAANQLLDSTDHQEPERLERIAVLFKSGAY
jgi:lysozyme